MTMLLYVTNGNLPEGHAPPFQSPTPHQPGCEIPSENRLKQHYSQLPAASERYRGTELELVFSLILWTQVSLRQ